MAPPPKLPSARPRDVKRALEEDGWREWRRRGSHAIMKKEGVALPVAVPMHRRDMPKGTLKSILKGAELTTEAFVDLLKK